MDIRFLLKLLSAACYVCDVCLVVDVAHVLIF